jgi:hypothetical protein
MPSVFTNSDEQTWNGSFRADDLVMTFAGGDGAGALVQQAQWNVQRAVNMLYEIGSANIYYVGNRRNGTITLNRVIGSSALYTTLITTFGDMCAPSSFELTSKFGCGKTAGTPLLNAGTGGGATGSRNWTMQHAIMTRIGASVTAQDITINETIDFMFSDMSIT